MKQSGTPDCVPAMYRVKLMSVLRSAEMLEAASESDLHVDRRVLASGRVFQVSIFGSSSFPSRSSPEKHPIGLVNCVDNSIPCVYLRAVVRAWARVHTCIVYMVVYAHRHTCMHACSMQTAMHAV